MITRRRRRRPVKRCTLAPADAPRRSAVPVLEQARLQLVGRHPSATGDERFHLGPADESAPPELDALEPAAPRPIADGLGPEVDVGRRQDVGGFGQRDPVGSGGHRQSTPEAGLEPPDEAEAASVVPDSRFAGSAPSSFEELPVSPPAAARPAAVADLTLDRSFFAQPLPLNTIAGAAMALRRACE